MPPKRKHDELEEDDEREAFRNRGDLQLYRSGQDADLVLIVGEQRIPLHRALLKTRVGKYKQLRTGRDDFPRDDKRRPRLTENSADAKSVRLVLEYVYGDWKIERLEFQSRNQPVIQECIHLFNLGHDFDIPRMVRYAMRHLGMYLSSRLKEICVYPLPKALEAAERQEFLDDLEAGINQAETARAGVTPFAQNNHPRRMLIDFIVVAGPVLLRKSAFHLRVDDNNLPAAFVKDTLLSLHALEYLTPWMKNLRVRPARLSKPEPKKRGACSSCGVGVAQDQKVVFNPWSGPRFEQKFSQFCCEDCAENMDEADGKGVLWDIFDDVKEE